MTGGAGYIGSNLVRGLLEDGVRVRVLDSLRKGDRGIRALYTNSDFQLFLGDLRRPEDVVRATRGVDAVIHLGAVSSAADCRRERAFVVETNLAATSLLTDVCRGLGVPRLVFGSSLDVYGRRRREVDETAPPRPQTLFAATKLDAERTILAAADEHFFPVAFRLGEVFGAEAQADFSSGLNRLVARAWRSGITPKRPASRPIYRTHVSDVCAVLRQALVSHPAVIGGEAFNVGCEQMRFTDAQVIALLAEAAPELEHAEVPGENVSAQGPAVSFRKLRSRMGVSCRGALRQGLAELLLHLRRGEALAAPKRPAGSERLPAAELAAARFLRAGEAGR